MLEEFLNSIEGDVSDDDTIGVPLDKRTLRLSTDCPIMKFETIVVAPKPFHTAVTHLLTPDTPRYDLVSDACIVGCVSVSGSCGLIILDREVRFNLTDMFECDDVIVLTSSLNIEDSSSNVLRCLSTNASVSSKFPYTASDIVRSTAAQLMTESLSTTRFQCTVLIDNRSSIRIGLDTVLRLWSGVSALIPGISTELASTLIKTNFHKEMPLNRTVPLYS